MFDWDHLNSCSLEPRSTGLIERAKHKKGRGFQKTNLNIGGNKKAHPTCFKIL